jgi:predicted NAD/FAD-binding protein
VTSIERTPRGVVVNDSHGGSDTYDHVVIASHSDSRWRCYPTPTIGNVPSSAPLAMPPTQFITCIATSD